MTVRAESRRTLRMALRAALGVALPCTARNIVLKGALA